MWSIKSEIIVSLLVFLPARATTQLLFLALIIIWESLRCLAHSTHYYPIQGCSVKPQTSFVQSKLKHMKHLKTLMTAKRALHWINRSHPVSCYCLILLRWRYLLISLLLKGTELYFLYCSTLKALGILLGFAKCKRRRTSSSKIYWLRHLDQEVPGPHIYWKGDVIPYCTHFIMCLPCSYTLPHPALLDPTVENVMKEHRHNL